MYVVRRVERSSKSKSLTHETFPQRLETELNKLQQAGYSIDCKVGAFDAILVATPVAADGS
jgi:hypothetical protein